RSQAFAARAWLSDHPLEGANPEVFQNFSTLLDRLEELSKAKRNLALAQSRFDARMDRLAKCNAQCKESSPAVPGVQPILGPADEEPKAACDACEGDALNLKALLALLQEWRLKLVLATDNRAAFDGFSDKFADLKLAGIKYWDAALLDASTNVALAEKEVEKARAALDLCNTS